MKIVDQIFIFRLNNNTHRVIFLILVLFVVLTVARNWWPSIPKQCEINIVRAVDRATPDT